MEKRILVVEHDSDFREAFARTLGKALSPEQTDVVFVGVGSVTEARSQLREGGLDAALIGVALPDGDGLDLVHEINDGGVGSPMPTLVWTTHLDPSVAIRALDAGAKGAFSKAVSVPEMAGAIRRLIEGGPSEA
jgi:DNA-binding NarL/FixJ family response regulator